MKIPDSLRLEHEQLHGKLAEATQLPGRTGEAARVLAKIMHPHLLREDEYATPPLGLLRQLAKGQMTPEMAEVLPLVARLKEEFPLMVEEHRAITAGLIQLGNAASQEGLRQWAEFADELRHHAQMEEEVFYPAAILVGEYVKASLISHAATHKE
jgi:Hemerythrin HHE cation binding domain